MCDNSIDVTSSKNGTVSVAPVQDTSCDTEAKNSEGIITSNEAAVDSDGTADAAEGAVADDAKEDIGVAKKKRNRRRRHGQRGTKNDEAASKMNVADVASTPPTGASSAEQSQAKPRTSECSVGVPERVGQEKEKKKKQQSNRAKAAGPKNAESSSLDVAHKTDAATVISRPEAPKDQPTEIGLMETEGEVKHRRTRRSARNKNATKPEQPANAGAAKTSRAAEASTTAVTKALSKSPKKHVEPEQKSGTQSSVTSGPRSKPTNYSGPLQRKTGTPHSQFGPLEGQVVVGFGAPKGQNQNRNKFQPYLDHQDVQLRLERGELIEGTVRINPKNYKDAFISSPDGRTADILVSEVQNRNRALEGDIVAIELNNPTEWVVLNDQIMDQMADNEDFRKLIERLDKNFAKSLSDSETDGAMSDDDDVIVEEVIHFENGQEVGREIPDKRETDRSNVGNNQHWPKCKNQELPSFSLDLVRRLPNWELYVQRTGRVVYIIEKNHTRKAAGHLEMFGDGNVNFALFKPTDNRIPRMKIPRKNCPPEFFVRSDDFKSFLFIAEIVQWDQVNYALGKLVQELGKDSDIDARTKAILMEKDIDIEEFSDEVSRCLPALPFVIPEEEIRKRRDFRQKCIFTIDPLTARDLDDAVSIEPLSGSRYRVGVHIADVSFFVRESTKLDEVAASRATSVYMVQMVVPMLPRTLCEDLCSLNPGVDRLTFSVEWIMNENGEIESEWFGRSVIKSCVKLAYEHAQMMINEPSREWKKEDELPALQSPWTYQEISAKVNMMQKIAVNLRRKRFESGALRIDQPKVCFILDKETWLPQTFKLFEARDSNRMIEEFMLLANMSVAKKLYNTYPSLAVLRRHPAPQFRNLEKVIKMLKPYGIVLDAQNSKSLQQSFDAFKARALGKGTEQNSEKKGRFEGRKKSKTEDRADAVDAETIKKCSSKAATAERVEHLVDRVDKISLGSDNDKLEAEDGDPESVLLKKSEKARMNISKEEVGLQSRKLYALSPLSREKKGELEFQVLMSLFAKPMLPAQYFCAENYPVEKCHHYALSVDLYTHFTSPIRRYPDILVHRLLDAALSGQSPNWSACNVSQQCTNCNIKKTNAKKASEKSDELFLTFFIKEMGLYKVHGMVIQVMDRSIDCLLMDMAVVKRVYFENLEDLLSYKFYRKGGGKKVLELKWKNKQAGNGSSVLTQRVKLFSHVMLTLQTKPGSEYDFNALLNNPFD